MNRMICTIVAITVTALVGGVSRVGSNISTEHRYAWSENMGWTNWRDAFNATDGVVARDAFLSGYIWGENAGWINVGNAPANGAAYANVDGSDFGVNVDPDGMLEGYAWGENIGWINFGVNWPTEVDRPQFDGSRFHGWAWGENAGWINLDDMEHYVATVDEPCTSNEGCDDSDFCTYDLCKAGSCWREPALYGDLAGTGGSCGPDKVIDLTDILTVLNGFAGTFDDPCSLHNIDIAGSEGSCGPDGVIGLSDIITVLDAFQGLDRCCAGRR